MGVKAGYDIVTLKHNHICPCLVNMESGGRGVSLPDLNP